MNTTTPLAESIRIVLAGLRNAGKSSLMNNLLRQDASIVSAKPGTTTDPVTRRIELDALGPAAVTDTAGLDDDEEGLGASRVGKSSAALAGADILVLVTASDRPWDAKERDLLDRWKGKPVLIALSFSDRAKDPAKADLVKKPASGSSVPAAFPGNEFTTVEVDNVSGKGIEECRKRLAQFGDLVDPEPTPVEGLVKEGDLAVLVTPVDLGAPAGRLILPQVETIRDLLDRDCGCMVVKERELGSFFAKLKERPAIVITDSQAFHKVAAELPEDQLLTSFSILFARKKGDLGFYVDGLSRFESLPEDPRILGLEGCSHHQKADDIGTVKIPRLFRQLIRPRAEFVHSRDVPKGGELGKIHGVIHCGSCMLKRRAVLARLETFREAGIPVTNYGLFLGWAQGVFPRVLKPFPDVLEIYERTKKNTTEAGSKITKLNQA